MPRQGLSALLLLVACVSASAAGRRVESNVLISDALPKTRIRVSDDFHYLGSFPFRIADVAAGERHVFADVEEGRVRRMIVAQFEGFLPTSSEIYRYDFTNAMEWGGLRFRENSFATNEPQYTKEHPGNEAALTSEFLRAKKLEVPDEWMITRFVTLGDESRKSEMILFYLEDLAPTGHTAAEMYAGEEPTEIWKRIRSLLRERARRAIDVVAR